VATFLHRHQTRANRKNLPRTPYIEHPLRNALRSVRWGCADQDVIVAAIMHDTVEDCAPDILTHYVGHPEPELLSEAERREVALGWMLRDFGPEVARIVEAVSNPLRDESGMSKERKRELYAEHVAEAIRADAKVFVVKFADFVDNALGLPHNAVEGNEGMIERLALKYLPVASVFEREYEANPDIRKMIGDEGHTLIGEQIAEAKTKLTALLKR
jgi:(p)ppGpp synthase/HD superfamily hydrolase